jgi:pimeloyl-ACP methyl ester carboxylesterase
MASQRCGLLVRAVLAALAVAACAPSARGPVVHASRPLPIVEVGETRGAPHRIDIPRTWNGSLVIYCHGYRSTPVRFDAQERDGVAETFAALGYAVAQPGYSTGGYAIREAAGETEALRSYFATKYGLPTETWLAGSSLGGSLTMMLMELHPTTYEGGLALCAPLGPALAYIKVVAFDLLVLFQAAFPGLLPSPASVPPAFVMTVARVEALSQALDRNPEAADRLRRYSTARTNRELAPILDLFTYILGELQRRWGGNAFDNRDTLYGGLGDDARINWEVQRYRADPTAQAMAVRDYTPTGAIERPLLSVRNLYDPLIGSFRSDRYAEAVQSRGRGSFFAQVASLGAGHCEIPPGEIRAAFMALRLWRRTGERPQPGVFTHGPTSLSAHPLEKRR